MEGEKIGGYESNLTPRAERIRQQFNLETEKRRKEYTEARPEDIRLLEHILSTIDLGVVKNIFLEQLEKSGVPLDNANTEAIQNIFLDAETTSAASYSDFKNDITIGTENNVISEVKRLFADHQEIPEEILLELRLLICHELSHAFSRIRLTSKDGSDEQSMITTQGGYRIQNSEFDSPEKQDAEGTFLGSEDFFEALNEGITERIAEEVFLEYGKRTGESLRTENFLTKMVEINAETLHRYSIFANEIDEVCDRIGNYVDVPKEQVWNAFKRGYFEKPEIFAEETIFLLKETFGESFLHDYKKIGTESTYQTLAEFDSEHDIPHPEEYAKKWILHLNLQKS